MKVLQDDTHGAVSLTATELLYANVDGVAASPYYLRQACQVNISVEAAKPAFLYLMDKDAQTKPLSTYFEEFSVETDVHALEYTAAGKLRCTNVPNEIFYERPGVWLLKLVEDIVKPMARALRANVKYCKLVTVPSSGTFVSVSLCPIAAT